MILTILRHGKPELLSDQAVSAAGLAAWIDKYNQSGVTAGCLPPNDVSKHAQACAQVVCSTLQKSHQSAALLGTGKPLIVDRLYTEAALPNAEWRRLKLKPKYWAVFFRLCWFLGYSRDCESYADAKHRASVAALQLIEIAKQKQSVLLVGHGIFNRLIARELRAQGWSGPRHPGANTGITAFSIKIFNKRFNKTRSIQILLILPCAAPLIWRTS